jgi:hypothetical protein
VIEHQMQLHSTLRAPKPCPVIHRHTQINRRGVQAHQLVLEPEFSLAIDLGNHLVEQPVEDPLEELPRAVLVGIGQRRANRCLNSKMRKLALAALQPALNLAQRMRPTQLAEQHAHELRPARQPLAAVLGTRFLHKALKFNTRNQLENLAEHAA